MKKVLFGALIIAYSFVYYSCSSGTQTEEVILPTQGLITVVKEVETDKFLIDDEITIPKTEESLIVANYLDGLSDTFTLAEAQLLQQTEGTRSSGVARAASFGFMGYMMGRSMGSYSPTAGAYTSPNKFNQVNNAAGSTLRNTASRTTRPASGKSGYGGSKSSRSYGG